METRRDLIGVLLSVFNCREGAKIPRFQFLNPKPYLPPSLQIVYFLIDRKIQGLKLWMLINGMIEEIDA
ncbi:hypothetical protein ACHQM5_003419 [Ranunculus cassubicifolius]